jgi:hypothetical protein
LWLPSFLSYTDINTLSNSFTMNLKRLTFNQQLQNGAGLPAGHAQQDAGQEAAITH